MSAAPASPSATSSAALVASTLSLIDQISELLRNAAVEAGDVFHSCRLTRLAVGFQELKRPFNRIADQLDVVK